MLVDDIRNPVLADFGLSRIIQDLDPQSQNNTQSSVGSQDYSCSVRWTDVHYFKDPSRVNRFAADICAFGRLVLVRLSFTLLTDHFIKFLVTGTLDK